MNYIRIVSELHPFPVQKRIDEQILVVLDFTYKGSCGLCVIHEHDVVLSRVIDETWYWRVLRLFHLSKNWKMDHSQL